MNMMMIIVLVIKLVFNLINNLKNRVLFYNLNIKNVFLIIIVK